MKVILLVLILSLFSCGESGKSNNNNTSKNSSKVSKFFSANTTFIHYLPDLSCDYPSKLSWNLTRSKCVHSISFNSDGTSKIMIKDDIHFGVYTRRNDRVIFTPKPGELTDLGEVELKFLQSGVIIDQYGNTWHNKKNQAKTFSCIIESKQVARPGWMWDITTDPFDLSIGEKIRFVTEPSFGRSEYWLHPREPLPNFGGYYTYSKYIRLCRSEHGHLFIDDSKSNKKCSDIASTQDIHNEEYISIHELECKKVL